ncbi:MAG: urease subunit beta [Actinomycetota bacterium]
MHLSPTELARLQIFQAAELARRNRAAGLALNAPEAIAIACDEMHLAARTGGSIEDVMRAGAASVAPGELLDGVAGLVAEIRLEVMLGEGTRLVVLRGLGDNGERTLHPGEVRTAAGEVTVNPGLDVFELEVTNTSDHPVRISSHFPFERTNQRLSFDRAAAGGTRLDIPAGDTVRWAPGETRTVRLVRIPEGRA